MCVKFGLIEKSNAYNMYIRQSSRTYGLSILECALALMLPNQLPREIVNEIFSVKFLDRLDTEVEACYSKVLLLL